MDNIQSEKCASCPRVALYSEGITEIEQHKLGLTDLITREDIELIFPILLEAISNPDVSDPLFVRMAEEVKSLPHEEGMQFLRTEIASQLNTIDERIDYIQHNIAHLALNCHGPIHLRGSQDNRRQFTVTVCASPAITGDGPEPATVKRTIL